MIVFASMISPLSIIAKASSSVGSRISMSSLSLMPAALASPIARAVFCSKEVRLSARLPQPQIGLERASRLALHVPRFLFGFLYDSGYGAFAFEAPGADFDSAFMIVLQICRQESRRRNR
jgi:hypothetical protein